MFLCIASGAAHTALDFYGQSIFVEQTDYITFTHEGGTFTAIYIWFSNDKGCLGDRQEQYSEHTHTVNGL